MVFIACELFGYGFAAFIFILAIIEGFVKARAVLLRFNRIPERVRQDHAIKLIQKPLNAKYWFMQLQIVQQSGETYIELDDRTKKEIQDYLV